ncbi:MAG TPA: hypothetical protein VFU21_23805 [Kofleriaceae bacterium]|nr:hypothetical protein [Kofleriaceae bacterium]
MTFPGTACRVLIVAGAAAAALASGSSNANRPADAPPGGETSAPASQPMDAAEALGLWKTNFGPVKIEKDPDSGEGNVRGVWVYDRSGEEVIGYFSGPLDGNVLQFRWVEPARPNDLVGDGYIVFDPQSRTFSGRWWTTDKMRGGEFTGRRKDVADPAGAAPDPGGAPPPAGEPPPPPPEDQGPPPEETI